MYRKALLIFSLVVLSGCTTFGPTKPEIEVKIVQPEPLNLEIPSRPNLSKSKSIIWKYDPETDIVSTSKKEFMLLLEDLLNTARYTYNLEDFANSYKNYVDDK